MSTALASTLTTTGLTPNPSCLTVPTPYRLIRVGLLYLNPPYDWTLGPADSRRTEQSFLSHTYRWLKPGGILLFLIPGDRLSECSHILAAHFRDVRFYRD